MDWPALSVFVLLFAAVTVLGFLGPLWQRGDLDVLHEWALAGRRFGTWLTWFLIGGDLYTAYTFVALPGLVFATGSAGFFSLPYTAIAYPIAFVFASRFWNVARNRHYITFADFARERYDSRGLALAVAVTGILATMPYIALQLVGIKVAIAAMGLTGQRWLSDLPIIVAFVLLAAYTYRGGLRAPALVAIVKDVLIYVTVIGALIVITSKLGGMAHVFELAGRALATQPKPAHLILAPAGYSIYVTLAVGSALALFMYPHSITAVLSASSANVVRRNMALLPAYSVLLGILAFFGYLALAAGIKPATSNDVVPQLFVHMLPQWFAGFGLAAIAIGALVPAAIMSIAAANLFTRNIYREYIKPGCSGIAESRNAKIVSLVVKFAIELQLIAGCWILQTLPTLIIGLYTRWFHRAALLVSWALGMIALTVLWIGNAFSTALPLRIGASVQHVYLGLFMLLVNVLIAIALTWTFDALRIPRGADRTQPADYADGIAGTKGS
ncbi:MAG: sodium:solute symporter family protein [Candidatus Eremiobacteraeota bacterium]|nr:sodium:solute symporter family protein [Candidatus Eremiobacteraeota bacterium]